MIGSIIKRDWRTLKNSPGQALMTPVFFVLATALFPLALGTDPQLLTLAAPGLLVITALFSSILPLEILFYTDRKDGTMDTILSSSGSLLSYTIGKLLSHWIFCGLTLVIVAPAMAVTLGLGGYWQNMMFILFPATILLSLIGAFGAALTLGTKQGSILLALLVLPLYIPVMIFAAGAIDMVRAGENNLAPICLLWAMTALALPVMPLVISAVLRFQIKT